jgi:protein TonB
MFANLIESDSHTREFKRRSSFFLATVAAYALILFGAGIASIYAYDARLEAQTDSLEVLNWIPPVTPAAHPPQETHALPPRRSAPSNAPVDRSISVAERRNAFARTDDPTRIPDHPEVTPASDPPVTGQFRLSNRNVDPPFVASSNSSNCISCSGTAPAVKVDTTPPPPPTPPKPKTETVTSRVLASKAISLPQPPYPSMARQIHAQGSVNVQILVDEQGKVVSAQAVSGHPLLTSAAKEAALRARFTPTLLNGQAVKVQGVITYNFVLQ